MFQITAHGNVGRDAELKEVNDTQVASFSLAVSTGRDETLWINCAVWGKRASTAAEYLKKGSKITVVGSGKMREFQKKDGSTGSSVECAVQQFTLPPREKQEEVPF